MSPLVEVGGRPTWHEVCGTGPTVVLLHGGLSRSGATPDLTATLVDAGHRVHEPDRRGHGRTPDVGGPITYAAMAEDTVAYLDAVVGGPAMVVGWSDGAVVALLVAMRRPDLVSRMVLIGQYFHRSGRVDGGVTDQLIGDPDVREYLRRDYASLAPAGDFDSFLDRCLTMWATEPEIEFASLADVSTPTLVLQGDRDDVRLDHSVAVVEALPNGRLAVLPGTHMLPIETPAVVNALIVSFLAGDAPTSPGTVQTSTGAP